MPRVLVSDKLESSGLALLKEAGMELDERHGLTGAALQEAVRGPTASSCEAARG